MLIQAGVDRESRGGSLGIVLLTTFVVALLVFALASSSVTHLHLSHRAGNAQTALTMAESAVAAGLEKILQDQDHGSTSAQAHDVLLGSSNSTKALLTFNPGVADQNLTLYSTNNLEGDSSVQGAAGRVVPANSVHLVGMGYCNGVTRKVEAIFHLPKFPFVVATAGTLSTQGETLIGSVDNAGQWNSTDDLKPGHIVSNSSEETALTLGAQTKITGDAKARGGVKIEAGAEILGEVRENHSQTEIPNYTVSDFDPELTGRMNVSDLNQGVLRGPAFEGWAKRRGDLLVNRGLSLDNGVLYVDGNLTISGGVKGRGAIIATGDVRITGHSSFSSDNMAAVLAGGDLSISGMGSENSVLRGVLYSNGNLSTENVALVGTVLAAEKSGEVTFKDSRLLYSPDSVALTSASETNQQTTLTFVSPQGANPGAFLGEDNDGDGAKIQIGVRVDSGGEFIIEPYPSDDDDADYNDDASVPQSLSVARSMAVSSAPHASMSEPESFRAYTEAEALEIIRGLVGATDPDHMRAFDSTTNPKLTNILASMSHGSDSQNSGTTGEVLEIDPSRFLGVADRIRLVMFREI